MGFLIGLVFVLLATSAEAVETPDEEKGTSCIACHRELAGPMAEPVTLWEKSIHHPMGNSCEGCHGGDPTDPGEAMNPAKGFVGSPRPEEVPNFCGKCHVGVLENYQKSPHAAAFQEGRGPSCVTCHRSHDIQRASFDLISEELCGSCHSFDNGRTMKRAFVAAERGLGEMRDELASLDRRGMPVKKLEEKLFAERNALHQMTHTLDVTLIEGKTRGVLADLEMMKKETTALRQRIRQRWWTGGLVGAFLLVLITVLFRFLKTFEEEA